jgi:hypothetical protein
MSGFNIADRFVDLSKTCEMPYKRVFGNFRMSENMRKAKLC